MRLIFFLACYMFCASSTAQSYYTPLGAKAISPSVDQLCRRSLKTLPGEYNDIKVNQVCRKVEVFHACKSVNGETIFHFDSLSSSHSAKKVLVMGVIHGDESEGGSVARRWMERLSDINARNSWRIIPIANPDGWRLKTRTNTNGVDLNRNFPSRDWNRLAHKYWDEKKNKDPRRNPGPHAGSEPETQCIIQHLDDFKPDFVVAIHTPYGVLDFDGPQISAPKFKWLPWVSLGTFPGSLGRYMWKDQKVPVLTVELKDARILEKMDEVDFLQDIAGTVAIKAGKSVSSYMNPASSSASSSNASN